MCECLASGVILPPLCVIHKKTVRKWNVLHMKTLVHTSQRSSDADSHNTIMEVIDNGVIHFQMLARKTDHRSKTTTYIILQYLEHKWTSTITIFRVSVCLKAL